MTISTTDDPRAGPYNGNDSQTAFPFSFKVFEEEDLRVVHTDADGVDTDLTLDSDFSVSLNADQNSSPGGTVTYPMSGDPLPDGETLTITSDLDYTQETDIQNAGGFYPEVIENALDRITMLVKQVHTKVVRTLQLSVTTPDGVDASLPAPVAASVVGWNAAGTALRNYLLSDGITVVGVNPDDLANDSDATKGSAMVGHFSAASGAAATTVRDRLNRLPLGLRADFGCAADGTTDDRDTIVAAMSTAAAAGRVLLAESGTYACSDWLPLPSGLKMRFEEGAVFKLTSATTPGGFVIGGYDIDLDPVDFSDVDIEGMTLDCNSISGENGFSALNADGVRLYRPRVINCLHNASTLGGRAFQFEGGDAIGVQVFDPVIEDSTIGINSNADAAGGTQQARAITYYNVAMRNVDVPFNVDAGFLNPENGTLENMSTAVFGASLWDCGKLTYGGATATGGGIVCADRGGGLLIDGLRVINTSAYGTIGALVRGMIYNSRLRNVEFNAAATALYDSNYVTLGDPSVSAIGATLETENVRSTGNLDYVVKAQSGGWGAAKLHASVSGASLTGILDANAGAATSAYLHFVDADTQQSPGWMRFADVYNGGNAAANFTQVRTGFATVQTVRNCADETNTPLFSVAAPNDSRISIAYQVAAMYPASTTDAGVVTQTGIVSVCVDGGGNVTSDVTVTDNATALDGAASFTLTVSVLHSSGDLYFVVNQANETTDTALDVYVKADVIYSVGATRRQPEITLS